MKRFFFLALTVVFSVCLFVIPAFASSGDIILDSDGFDLTTEVTEQFTGYYRLALFDVSGDVFWTSDPIFIDTAIGGEKCIVSPGPADDEFTLCYRWEVASTGYMFYFYSNEVESGETLLELYNFSAVALIPVSSVEPEPTPSNFLADIGTFFTSAISWLGNVASFIVSRPVFLVVLAMPIIGFAVGLFSRIKNL